MPNGGEHDRTGFGHSADGFLSTRNILMAAVVTALGGSATALIQSNEPRDRWTGSDQKQWIKSHNERHEAERKLAEIEHTSIRERAARNEGAVLLHQDGHKGRIIAEAARIERLEENLRNLERAFDRGHREQ